MPAGKKRYIKAGKWCISELFWKLRLWTEL